MLWIVRILFLLSLPSVTQAQISSLGWFVNNNELKATYRVSDQSADELASYVVRHSQLEIENAFQMSLQINVVAECFGFDPLVYSSLVRKESAYKYDAVSPTGAKGLTQMTSAGVQEAHDQLGQRGPEHARRSNTEYFYQVIEDCIEPRLLSEVFIPVWLRNGLDNMSDYKNEMINSPKTSLIYGAIQFKTLLAKCVNSDIWVRYRCALEHYNGDRVNNHHIVYARTILRWVQAELD